MSGYARPLRCSASSRSVAAPAPNRHRPRTPAVPSLPATGSGASAPTTQTDFHRAISPRDRAISSPPRDPAGLRERPAEHPWQLLTAEVLLDMAGRDRRGHPSPARRPRNGTTASGAPRSPCPAHHPLGPRRDLARPVFVPVRARRSREATCRTSAPGGATTPALVNRAMSRYSSQR
jgi:hypothetical protein